MTPRFETPPKASISITNTCNLRCKHCYANCGERPAPNELSRDEWIGFIDYLVEHQFIQVYIEGGEPFHRPDFKDILRHCGRKLMTLVRTNGTLIDRGTARELKAFGVGRLFVDIWGATAATHDDLTGKNGSFESACNAVRHLVGTGVRTDMLIILSRRNAHEINDYLAMAHELGAERVGILRLYPIGRAKHCWSELALSLEEQMDVIRNLRPPKGLGVMQSWHPNDRNCCWQAATVNATGDSIGCSYLREYVNYGNIREMDFLETWRHPLYQRLRAGEVDQSCGDCSASQGTRGGCRSAAFAFHGRWDAPDPFCTNLNQGVDLRVLPDWLLQKSPRPPNTSGA